MRGKITAFLASLALVLAFVTPVWAQGWVQLSNAAYYRMTKMVVLTNTGSHSAYDVTALVTLLPPKTAYAHLSLIEDSQKPASTTIDAYGNTIGKFVWSRLKPGQSVTLTLDYQVQSAAIHYQFPVGSQTDPFPQGLLRQYTNPALEHAEVNTGAPAIASLDKRLAPSYDPPLAKARAYFDWIATHIHYNYSLKPAGSALAVLQTRLGICTDFAQLFVGMLRTAHIPARVVNGYVMNNGAGQGGFHQWVEFYVPPVGWIVSDPTWGTVGYFAQLEDNWHIPLYDGLRPDVNVSWKYVPPTHPYIHIQYHYNFSTESAPAVHAIRDPLPVLPPPHTGSIHHHADRIAPQPYWTAIIEARLAFVWRWFTRAIAAILHRLI